MAPQCEKCTDAIKIKQARVYYNAGALKLKEAKKNAMEAKRARTKAKEYYFVTAKKFALVEAYNKENEVPFYQEAKFERRAATKAREALKRQSRKKPDLAIETC